MSVQTQYYGQIYYAIIKGLEENLFNKKNLQVSKKKRKVNNPLLEWPVLEGIRSKKTKKRRGLEEC